MNTEKAEINTWEKQEMVRLLKGAPGTSYQEADEVNKAIFRDWIRSLLQSQPVTVTFIKSDGTERVMKCTLNWNFIPAAEHAIKPVSESAKPRKEPDPSVIRAYDLEKAEWRSFRMDRLKSISAEINFS